MIKLFLITRTDDVYYDQYESMVVASKTAEAAIKYDPLYLSPDARENVMSYWTSPEFLDVKYIGDAAPGIEEGVIMSSYRN